MEDILGALLRVIGTLVMEVLVRTVFYWVGWPFVKILSLGRYPRRGWMSDSFEESGVCLVGVVVLVGAVVWLVTLSGP